MSEIADFLDSIIFHHSNCYQIITCKPKSFITLQVILIARRNILILLSNIHENHWKPYDPLEGKSGASSHVNQDDNSHIERNSQQNILNTIANYSTRISIHALTNTTLELNYDNAIETNLQLRFNCQTSSEELMSNPHITCRAWVKRGAWQKHHHRKWVLT